MLARPKTERRPQVRELEESEPELFETGGRDIWRDCCARLAGCSTADADALFRLVDDDRDGVLGRRELVLFVRDQGESWSRRAGLDAEALDRSPRSAGDADDGVDDDDDDEKSVAFEPLVRALLRSDVEARHHPHLRAVARRVAAALGVERDESYRAPSGHLPVRPRRRRDPRGGAATRFDPCWVRGQSTSPRRRRDLF